MDEKQSISREQKHPDFIWETPKQDNDQISITVAITEKF